MKSPDASPTFKSSVVTSIKLGKAVPLMLVAEDWATEQALNENKERATAQAKSLTDGIDTIALAMNTTAMQTTKSERREEKRSICGQADKSQRPCSGTLGN